MKQYAQLAPLFEKYGFSVKVFASAKEAKDYLLGAIGPNESVGIGGSSTVKELNLAEDLRSRGNTVNWHWGAKDMDAARRAANSSNVYLCSANAITETGKIVNIDFNGNRIGATLHGPDRVYMIIGKNKLCKDLESALDRARNVAAPKNARRLGYKTPCGVLGYCTDCSHENRMCHAILIFERCPAGRQIELVLVEEELGY